MNTLLDMVRGYLELLERKDQLADETKANNAAIEEAKNEIAQIMVEEDCPAVSLGGYRFSLSEKTVYNKKSEAKIAESGTTLFDALREEGLGSIIVETVNPRTLQSTMKAYVAENGELSEGLARIIEPYETMDITRRKETNRTKKGAKT